MIVQDDRLCVYRNASTTAHTGLSADLKSIPVTASAIIYCDYELLQGELKSPE